MMARWVTCGWVVGMVVLLQAAPVRGGDAAVRPDVGIGFMASPGFHEYMSDLSSDGDAASAWAAFHISAKIGLSDHWSLVPVLDICANGNGDGRGFSNGMQILGLNVRCAFGDRSAFHIQAGPSLVLASGGGDDADFEGGNLGGEASIGYGFRIKRTRFGPEIGLGYSYCPVDATRISDHQTTTENFGGPFFRVGFRF